MWCIENMGTSQLQNDIRSQLHKQSIEEAVSGDVGSSRFTIDHPFSYSNVLIIDSVQPKRSFWWFPATTLAVSSQPLADVIPAYHKTPFWVLFYSWCLQHHSATSHCDSVSNFITLLTTIPLNIACCTYGVDEWLLHNSHTQPRQDWGNNIWNF